MKPPLDAGHGDEASSLVAIAALNRLCVRLVFCLYAEDADIFPKDCFRRLLEATPAQFLRKRLLDLFAVLDTPPERRDPYLEPELAAFPYTNGGLFSLATKNTKDTKEDGKLCEHLRSLRQNNSDAIPPLTEHIRQLLINASLFDWRDISPTIFGALFESTLNPQKRRAGGMHYTSIENIHKVIDPLFLDKFTARVEEILTQRRRDAECGRCAVDERSESEGRFREAKPVRRASVRASSMKPPSGTSHGDEASSLVAGAGNLFIIGNPPFVGGKLMDAAQKADMLNVFGKKWKNLGNMDYVCCWYKKAWEFMRGTSARAALVSTNSIAQGQAVASLLGPLMEQGLEIGFAHLTFRWDSEASDKAHVHCVIVGFHANGDVLTQRRRDAEGGARFIATAGAEYGDEASSLVGRCAVDERSESEGRFREAKPVGRASVRAVSMKPPSGDAAASSMPPYQDAINCVPPVSDVSREQIRVLKTKIAATAQAILDARSRHPDSSLADIYEKPSCPPTCGRSTRRTTARFSPPTASRPTRPNRRSSRICSASTRRFHRNRPASGAKRRNDGGRSGSGGGCEERTQTRATDTVRVRCEN